MKYTAEEKKDLLDRFHREDDWLDKHWFAIAANGRILGSYYPDNFDLFLTYLEDIVTGGKPVGVTTDPLRRMPIHMHDENGGIAIIATWRLACNI